MNDLLLLHGAIGAKDQLEAVSLALHNDFTVHTLNFSGHGGLPVPQIFSIARFAEDVIDYLDEHDIAGIDIFGYSMGGYVALYLARHYPHKIKSIFTLGTKFEWTPEIASRETKMLDARKIADKIPAFAKQLELRHTPADWSEVLSRTVGMMNAMGNEKPLQNDDFQQILNRVIIAIGDKDAMVTLEESIAVYRKLPNANLIVLPETAHPLEKINVGRLAWAVCDFFK